MVVVTVYVVKYMTLQMYIRHACPQDCGFQNMPSLMSVKLTYKSSGGFDEGSVHAVHLVIETTGVT